VHYKSHSVYSDYTLTDIARMKLTFLITKIHIVYSVMQKKVESKLKALNLFKYLEY